MHVAFRLLCALVTFAGLHAGDLSTSELKALLDAHDWFQLRRVVEGRDVGDFYKGQVACAFQDIHGAERHFRRVIASGDPKQAFDAHGRLAHLYVRTGQHRETYKHLSAMQRLNPEFSGLRNALTMYAALRHHPELSVQQRKASRILITEDFFIPVSVNGTTASYGFDTGAALSFMSEAEATRLGLRVHEASGSEYRDDASGNAVPLRFVVVDRLALGGFELRNAVFSIIPQGALPFRDLPADRQGVLGLPVLLALGTIGWDTGRMLHIGYSSPHRRAPNLCFDETIPLVEVVYDGRSMTGWFDTGNGKTYLTSRFLQDLKYATVEGSRKRKTTVRGVGGTTDVEILQMPKIEFAVGGSDLTLSPAEVLPEQRNVDRNSYHVWLGMDLLGGRPVIIDFRSMAVVVGPAAN